MKGIISSTQCVAESSHSVTYSYLLLGHFTCWHEIHFVINWAFYFNRCHELVIFVAHLLNSFPTEQKPKEEAGIFSPLPRINGWILDQKVSVINLKLLPKTFIREEIIKETGMVRHYAQQLCWNQEFLVQWWVPRATESSLVVGGGCMWPVVIGQDPGCTFYFLSLVLQHSDPFLECLNTLL